MTQAPAKLQKPILIFLLALLVACGGDPGDVTGRTAALVDAAPLPTFGDDSWKNTFEGCESRLTGDEQFSITRPDALLVAEREGAAVCVDTLDAVTLELEAIGSPAVADEVYEGFYAAVHLAPLEDWGAIGPTALPVFGAADADDDKASPHPDPFGGEPRPHPGNPYEGNPNPQPNLPTDSDQSDSHHNFIGLTFLIDG